MQDLNLSQPQAISLLEFNGRIKRLLNDSSVLNCWVMAETSDVRINRHCYLELLQKNPNTGETIARIRAVIWANTFQRLSYNFMQVTGQPFNNGMKVMVLVSASFHEQYGISLVINDINPEFTLGDMARRRIEIIQRLTSEGIINMNKELEWPEVPQRIAVISAQGAAGYGDFMNQLRNNPYGLKFYTALFGAVMQGQQTVPSVIAALEKIGANEDLFDCVVIIRGGGSTTDLNWFDDYTLAANVAQFPLPVIVGIGHERDVTVLDYVAAERVKTPTAAAELLIGKGSAALAHLTELTNDVVNIARNYISRSSEQLAYLSSTIPMAARHLAERARMQLQQFMSNIPLHAKSRIDAEGEKLGRTADRIKDAAARAMLKEQMRLEAMNDKVQLLSPRNTLNRGYSLTLCNGKAVTDASQLKAGDVITSHFKTGHVQSTVK